MSLIDYREARRSGAVCTYREWLKTLRNAMPRSAAIPAPVLPAHLKTARQSPRKNAQEDGQGDGPVKKHIPAGTRASFFRRARALASGRFPQIPAPSRPACALYNFRDQGRSREYRQSSARAGAGRWLLLAAVLIAGRAFLKIRPTSFANSTPSRSARQPEKEAAR